MFVCIQATLLQFGAVIKEFTLDDKGYVVVAGFGVPPFIHPHDEQRAVSSAMRIHADLKAMGVHCTIGLSTGVIFCSAIGSKRRREFALVGPAMNLAARLMCSSSNNGVLVDEETHNAARSSFVFKVVQPIKVKNIKEPVPVFEPTLVGADAEDDAKKGTFSMSRLIGRHREQKVLMTSVHKLWRGRTGGWIAVEGDPGTGKSSIVRHCADAAEKLGLRVVPASGDPVEAGGPHKVWREVLIQLLLGHQTLAGTPDWDSHEIASIVSEVLCDSQAQYAFLLNDLVPLPIAPTADTAAAVAQLTPAQRAEKLIGLVYTMVVAAANDLLPSFDCGERLLLVIEDATWLDPLSCRLLHRLTEKANDCILIWTVARTITTTATPGSHASPSAMALAHRSNEWTLNGVLARGDPNIQRLTVSPMTSEDLGRMLVKQLGCKRIQHMALKLLHARSGGNPYFAQQLGAHMLQHGLLEIVPADVEDAAGDDSRQAAAAALLSKSAGDLDAASPPPSDMELRLATAVNWSTVRVPHTLERAIFAELTRVVTPAELFTLKIASVIGRTFSLEILYRVHPTPNFVQQHLRRLIELQYLEVPDGGGGGDNVDDDASGDRAPTPVSSTADPATRSSNARTRRLRRLSGSGISGSRGRRRSSASSGESEGMQPPPTPSGSGVAGDAAVPADAAAAAAAVGSPRLMPPVPVRAGTGSSPNTPPVSSRHGQPLRQPVYVVVSRCVQVGPLAAVATTIVLTAVCVLACVVACTCMHQVGNARYGRSTTHTEEFRPQQRRCQPGFSGHASEPCEHRHRRCPPADRVCAQPWVWCTRSGGWGQHASCRPPCLPARQGRVDRH